ncbi:NADPH-dependent F420 reductase [Hamadaea tsunoensis]|uniref:NADPH-dependent F420 reductase n=1 Tax=Hamadaea tsunoensis TaxID=53368 RepID=UPI0004287B5D|nr:NAD(P)-binding domain-containing protein [Hamadaea tsunoensis]
MKIGILGTGNLAAALAEAWSRTGHDVTVAGRSAEKTAALAARLGVRAAAPADLDANEVVLVAIPWDGLAEAVASAGSLTGVIIDATNPVDWATGTLLPSTGSAVEQVAALQPSARVVKALHLYAGTSWPAPQAAGAAPKIVAMCGDDAEALEIAGRLVTDLGGTPAVVGGLAKGRQLEEVAGFAVSLVRNGLNPIHALPSVG